MTTLCPEERTPPLPPSTPSLHGTVSMSSTADAGARAEGVVFYVDGRGGSDSGSGTRASPFMTLGRAVEASRSVPERSNTSVTILLISEGSPYELSSPIQLGPADSHLTVASVGSGPAVLSGGRVVRPEWREVALPGRNASTTLRVFAASVSGSFTTLTVGGKRQVLARHPNADPETSLYPEGTTSASAKWGMPGGGAQPADKVMGRPGFSTSSLALGSPHLFGMCFGLDYRVATCACTHTNVHSLHTSPKIRRHAHHHATHVHTCTHTHTHTHTPSHSRTHTQRVVIDSPNRTEWLRMFGKSGATGSGMSAFYEYIEGGSAARFTPPICPGPTRTCCSNNFPYCGS
jgi:hypothetical protein